MFECVRRDGALVVLLVLALSMGLLMTANGEVSRGTLVLTSSAGPAYLIDRLRRGLSIIR